MMNENVAVFRDEAGLTEAHEIVRRLKEEAADRLHRRPRHGLQPGRAGRDRARLHARLRRGIVVGALERKESRGAQFRTDFPERNDDEWLKHIDLSLNGDDAPQGQLLAGDDHPVGARRSGRTEVAMAEFTLKHPPLRPESGEAAVLGGATRSTSTAHRSVLEGILQAKDRAGRLDRHPLLVPRGDLRLLRRAHQRPARRSPATPTSTRPPRRSPRRRDRGRADGQHARDQGPDRRHGRGPLEEDPARHAVAAARQASRPSASTSSRTRVDGRRHADDGLHPVRRLRLGLPVDGGRPAVHRPGRAGQGLPLRRRPARRPARSERLKDLAEDPHGIYDCTHCFNCIEACPKGVAPMSQIMRLRRIAGARPRDRRPQQRPPPRDGVRQATSSDNGLLHEADLLPDSYGGKFHPRAGARAASARCRSITTALLRGKVTPTKALLHTAQGRRKAGQADLRRASRTSDERYELNLYVAGDEDEPTPSTRGRRRRGARTHEGRLLARLREPRLHARAARLDGARSRRCSTSSSSSSTAPPAAAPA